LLPLSAARAQLAGQPQPSNPPPVQQPGDPNISQTPADALYYVLTQTPEHQNPVHGLWGPQQGGLNYFWVSGDAISGMTLTPVGDSLRAHLKLDKEKGLIVTAIEGHSPAAMAGIHRNDVLLKLGETPLGKIEDLEAALKAIGEKPAILTVLRGGRTRQIKVQGHVQVSLGPVEAETPEFWIGISVSAIDPALRSHLQLPNQEGLLIMEVFKDSPAAQAGLKVNDIALHLAGKPLTGQEQLVEIVQASGEKAIPVEVIRQGEHVTMQVTPQRRKKATFSFRLATPRTYSLDFVRPGAVLPRAPQDLHLGARLPGGPPVQYQPTTQYQTQHTQPGGKSPSQQAEADVSKRLDEMAAEIKEMRKAIEALSKSAKDRE
jgi:membrane-associated protease RseP (regulator of RpoE activity)